MNSNPEFREYFDGGLDQRDGDRIDQCIARQGEIYTDYRRASDEHDVDPEPVPHVHADHDEKAKRCRIAVWFTHPVGALVSFWWSYTASEHSVPVALAAVLVYATLALILDISCIAFAPRASFCRNFWKWFLPMVPVSVASACVLITERFASPEVASALLRYDSAAWLGLEISMLVLGAVSMVGQRRFDWSGALTRDYQTLEAEIAALRRKIDARKRATAAKAHAQEDKEGRKEALKDVGRPSGSTGLAVLLIAGLVSVGPLAKACPTALIDQTGSLAAMNEKEDRVSSALAVGVARQSGKPCLIMTPFSANPFSSAGIEISFTEHKTALFTPMRKAIEKTLETEALGKIRSSMHPRLPVARCTNISDAMILAANAPESALVYTDGKHDCPAPIRRGITSNHAVIVVLARSLGDGDSDADIFVRRRAVILNIVPKAIVLPEFELDTAVRLLFQSGATPVLVNATF